MEKQDSFQALLSMSPELKKAYDTLLPEDLLQNMPEHIKTPLQKRVQEFIKDIIKNRIFVLFFKTVKTNVSEYIADVINPSEIEQLKSYLIRYYKKINLSLSEADLDNAVQNIFNMVDFGSTNSIQQGSENA
jgi:hypothetical protein